MLTVTDERTKQTLINKVKKIFEFFSNNIELIDEKETRNFFALKNQESTV